MLTIDSQIHLIHLLAWAIGAGTLALSAWMGLRVRRETKTTGDYLLAGRRLGKAKLVAHGLATRSEMPSLIGSAGAFFAWSFVVPLLLAPLIYVLAPLFRRARFYTTADFFRSRFSLGLSLTYTAAALLFLCAASSTMIGAMIGFNHTWGGMSPEYPTVLGYAAAGVVLAYTTLGGLPSVVSAQMIQSAVVLILTVLIAAQSLSLPPATHFHGLDGLLFKADGRLISILAVSALGLIAHPCAMTVMSTGRSETDCQTGASLGFLLRRFTELGVLLAVGMTVARSGSGASQTVFIASIEWLLVQLVYIAALSSCFVAASVLVSRNIYKHAIRPAASDVQVLFVARASTLAVGAIAILGSRHVSGYSLMEYLAFGLACFGLLMLMGTLWRRGTVIGAWGSLIVMVGLWVALGPIGLQSNPVNEGSLIGSLGSTQFFPQLILVCLPMGIVSFVGFSMITRPVGKKQLGDFYLRLQTPTGQEGRLIEAGVELEYKGDEEIAAASPRDNARFWTGFSVVVAAAVIMSLIIAVILHRVA